MKSSARAGHDIAVGDGLLGRVIDPLAGLLMATAVASSKRLPIERPAAPIMDARLSRCSSDRPQSHCALIPLGVVNAS